ncbi:MAG: hypothetical protein H0Z33_06635 [Bacillaceae bacterium]|nr:hypothetical protein [Bacillaceae bacterium]
MSHWERPLGFGEVLDVTFRVVKEHFAKLFMIMVVLLGPVFLFQLLLLLMGGVPFVGSSLVGEGGWRQLFMGTETEWSVELNGGATFILYTLADFVLMTVAYILAVAAIILAVHSIREGKPLDLKDLIKQAGSRYWPLLGGSIVYLLVLSGIVTALVLILIFLGVGIDFMDTSIYEILTMVLLGLLAFFGASYFMTRWSFYFPAIVFEKVSPGLGKSWNLTRRQFWRLVGLYIVLTIILTIITALFQFVSQMLFGVSVVTNLFLYLVQMLTMLILFVAYAVVYFDLRIRNEAVDLKEMVDTYHTGPEISPAHEAGNAQAEGEQRDGDDPRSN